MSDTPSFALTDAVAAVGRFNRFYTRQIGLLDATLLKSDFTLTEARVLYELAHQNVPRTPTQLSQTLLIDPGYLSRILKGFEAHGLVLRAASSGDGRQTLLALTQAGRAALEPLALAAGVEIGGMLDRLGPDEMGCLIRSMQTVERLLGDREHGAMTLRP